MDVDALRDMFRAVVNHEYMLVDELTQAAHVDPVDAGDLLEALLDEDFGVFGETVRDPRALLLAVLGPGSSWQDLWCRREDDALHWTVGDYWSAMSDDMRALGHSLLDADLYRGSPEGRRAYEVIKQVLEEPRTVLTAGTTLWRARRGARITDIGAPPPERARAARVNQQGQPILYLADSRRTALYEVRPPIGDVVTLGRMRLLRDATVCDLTPDFEYTSPFSGEPDALQRYAEVSRAAQTRFALGRLLASPITPEDEARDYIPTQLLARIIRSLGFDGVKFPSAQRRSRRARNFALFDPRIATGYGRLVEVRVERVRYWYERCAPT